MSYTLLLADDSVTIQRVIELTFADEDIRVVAVGDGQQAIDRLKADPPDIVLADTGMPERDGYDVATFVKEDPALAHIPVVLLTGAFEPVDEDRARRVGCDAVLVKPFEPQVVIKRVRELLGQTAAPAGSERGTEASLPDAGSTASSLPLRPPGSVQDPDATLELASRPAAGMPEPGPPSGANQQGVTSDDPLADYLERMDEAFDRFEAGGTVAADRGAQELKTPPPVAEDTSASDDRFDSLDGALSVLEGALDKLGLEGLDLPDGDPPDDPDALPSLTDPVLPAPAGAGEAMEPAELAWSDPADTAPDTTAPQAPPRSESSEPVVPAPSEAVVEPTSGAAVPRLVETPAPAPESVTSPPTSAPPPSPPEPAAVSIPEPVVVSAPEPEAPPPEPSSGAEIPPVALEPPQPAPDDKPPSLADAFASLLAAEQGDAERARTVYPWPRPAPSPGVNEELIERVAERVVARLSTGITSELITQVVARVAEKLVREELDRTRQS